MTTMVYFDTLKYFKKLKTAGFTKEQAEILVKQQKIFLTAYVEAMQAKK